MDSKTGTLVPGLSCFVSSRLIPIAAGITLHPVLHVNILRVPLLCVITGLSSENPLSSMSPGRPWAQKGCFGASLTLLQGASPQEGWKCPESFLSSLQHLRSLLVESLGYMLLSSLGKPPQPLHLCQAVCIEEKEELYCHFAEEPRRALPSPKQTGFVPTCCKRYRLWQKGHWTDRWRPAF